MNGINTFPLLLQAFYVLRSSMLIKSSAYWAIIPMFDINSHVEPKNTKEHQYE